MKKILRVLLFVLIFSANIGFADNQQIYSKLNNYKDKSITKGNYSFDYKSDVFKVYDKSGKKLILSVNKGDFNYPDNFFVNDKYLYYTKTKQGNGSSIIQTELNTKESKAIKTFKVEVSLAGVRGNEIYYTVVSQHGGEMFEPELRVFNISSKKDLSIAKNATSVELGSTKIYYMNFLMELNPTKLYAVGYNYKSPKMISKNAVNYALIGGKLYIAESKIVNPDDEFDMNNLKNETLFVCNEDGSSKKALTGNINGYIYDITATEVRYEVIGSEKYYKMNLKTKKVESLNSQY